ncbi:putative B6 ABC transporter substrate-binding protein [Leucobacter denitrificans]|uniref:BMP family ABC transporter substrate-binding protein n=1 Tax=Leucobacter denitrificans TaxID=683042 RepID=A0A7G9S390_9MICO|nr:BMP family ABC transporter substrate-binding protein [Leucobacter denitrificans]QNN62315.1 BMP family ABC transporter substrate-binding protein [Leucobacter denitrificans]
MFFNHGKKRALRTGLVAATVVGLILTAGCSGRGDTGGGSGDGGGEEAAGQTVSQFAIVTPEKESDYGWNQQGIWAAQAAAEELGIDLDDNSNVGYDNTETILTQVAEGGNDLIIAHASGFNTAGHRVGMTTGVPTLVVDFDKNEPGKVATIITQAQEGAYLAGVAAANKTETNTVGIVASAEDLNWFLMSGGFAQGVYSVDPSINVVIAYVGPAGYGDSAGGTNVMNQVIAAGADVIMGMGDGATMGYLQAIESASTDYPLSYIATIGDVTEIVEDPALVLTSVLWNFKDSYVQAIKDVEAGTFGTETYELTVANGGLTLQETDNLTGDIAAAVEAAQAGIADGSITIERATDKDAVQAIIDAKGK